MRTTTASAALVLTASAALALCIATWSVPAFAADAKSIEAAAHGAYVTAINSNDVETLMADLAGHDRSPSSFLVYLILWHRSRGSERTRVPASLQAIAEDTGLSKRGVQDALRLLQRRGLVSRTRLHATAVPEYRVHRPWIRRKTRRAPSRRGRA